MNIDLQAVAAPRERLASPTGGAVRPAVQPGIDESLPS